MRIGVTLDEQVKSTLKDAAKKLTGSKKRAFMAKATEDYFEGSARKAETYLGWKRQAVQLGLHERRTGMVCIDNYSARGAKKTEDKLPRLASDIHELLADKCHADPQLKTPFRYTKVTAAAVLETLVTDKGYTTSDLPCRQTMGSILNR
ncbi:MAG: ISAzo13 family transposase, partial [Cyanobacteria bacterium J06638_22]